jgi:predicted transcriptional regulator
MMGIHGEKVEVTSIIRIYEPIEVIALDVEEVDNYFVGETPVVIHNPGPGKSFG